MARDPRVWRDIAIFSVGLAGATHEVFFTSLDRPATLALCGAMMGLATFLRSNGK